MAGVLDEDRLRALTLAAVDRFVLSLVDGKTSVRELAESVGISGEEVFASLLKLESMRVVVLPPAGGTARTPAPTATVATPAPGGEIDLEPEHQRQIDEIFGRLDALDHYGLLGVPRSADRKAIKRAYYEHTSRFHPDRFFRKKLGPFKLKMEAVFGRMTEAHDTLTAKDRRAEYDAYLASLQKTRTIEEMLAEAMSEMQRATDAIGAISSIPPPPASRPDVASDSQPIIKAFDPPSSPNLGSRLVDSLDGRVATKPPSVGRITVPPNRSEPPGAKGRREMLARRLTAGNLKPPPTPRPATIAFARTEDAVDALKRRYEDRVAAARDSQVKKYAQSGQDARVKGDMVAAANAFRVALSFDPENVELKVAHEEAQRASDQILVEQYLKQAEYEERSERWADAGRSWSRVARTRATDAKAHERAAFCMMKADGNLRDAVPLAQRAVQLEPKNVAYRKTMANVYLAAGLTLNAKRELEAAIQLAPDDAGTLALLKRIGKSA
jgi:tetratricopeptide (TPR) repeat protein